LKVLFYRLALGKKSQLGQAGTPRKTGEQEAERVRERKPLTKKKRGSESKVG